MVQAAVWRRFERAARAHKRNPSRLLTEFMRECLETWADQEVDEAIHDDAARSGYREQDAVALVRQYRREKREHRATT